MCQLKPTENRLLDLGFIGALKFILENSASTAGTKNDEDIQTFSNAIYFDLSESTDSSQRGKGPEISRAGASEDGERERSLLTKLVATQLCRKSLELPSTNGVP